MARFRIFKGNESNLSAAPMHEGYVYFTQDKGNLYIDVSNEEGGRIQVNSYAAQILRDSSGTEINIDDIFLKNMVASIAQGGTGAADVVTARTNLGVAAKGKCTDVSLAVDGWTGTGPYTQSVTVQGVTVDNLIIPSPTPNSWELAGEAMSYCSAQAEDSLTFTCKKKPTTELTYTVLIQEV